MLHKVLTYRAKQLLIATILHNYETFLQKQFAINNILCIFAAETNEKRNSEKNNDQKNNNQMINDQINNNQMMNDQKNNKERIIIHQ